MENESIQSILEALSKIQAHLDSGKPLSDESREFLHDADLTVWEVVYEIEGA